MPGEHNGFGSICAIVVTYNSGRTYIANFVAIKDQVDKIIIVDNGSGEETKSSLKNLGRENKDKLEVIYNPENLGLAKAQNYGIKRALAEGYDWIMLLDDDSQAMSDMALEMMQGYFANPVKAKIGIIAPYIEEQSVAKTQCGLVQYGGIFFKKIPVKNIVYVNGILYAIASGSMIKRPVLQEIGMMREDFFIDFIDLEYTSRAISRGWKIMVAGKAILKHRIGNRTTHDFFGLKFVTSNQSAERKRMSSSNRSVFWRLYWRKVPSLVLYSFLVAFFEIFLILNFEEDKLNKLRNIMVGTWEGFCRKING